MKSHQPVYLHANAYMASVYDLLQLMTIAELTAINLDGIFRRSQRAIANITDAQIDEFVKQQKEHAAQTGRLQHHFGQDTLANLATQLRIRRNAAIKPATRH